MSTPSKEAMEAARAICAGLDSAEHPIRGPQVIEVAQRIDAAADARYLRLKAVAQKLNERILAGEKEYGFAEGAAKQDAYELRAALAELEAK